MRELHQVAASEIAVIPYYLKGYQQHGLQYRINQYERAEPLGAQCSNCHTIVWITGRSDPILFKEAPNNQESYHDHNRRFLKSLPACPHCHQQAYDLFINNITLKRFEDGNPFPQEFYGVDEEMSAKVKDIPVWWYGDEAEAKRLNLHFL
ncbi:hypothetical protein [Acinetobacter higginsii]|uniref:hypothetical protein n=1 Tax=Acinetobacter higginsii TaxID=70347 RepID=UPI001F4AF810|nr:hypothetical protein [Acinetobacter higginsii]MCH7295610.1 hypothetical protein [Acinetobacter higginsii]MCH7305533.1 hypothetical protein [Acinetobacter higginsii]MCH7338584.1 hypothetical protein [Acinetobacter higginsii]MCI3877515.1 hypothetical protein [Acinetobacter higginsii]